MNSETVRFKLFKTMWSHVAVSPELYVKGEDGRVIRIFWRGGVGNGGNGWEEEG